MKHTYPIKTSRLRELKPIKYCGSVLATIGLLLSSALADDTSLSFDTSLEDLAEHVVSVASQSKRSIRSAPGVISVVTAEEIRKSGARDLIDALSLIPGVQFGVDVQGVVGIAVRGLWAHEGKALLLWNGHEMNELLYSTTQFGNHYPVEQIERIEMIRGPGSALYGGFAELAVINVLTKTAKNIENGYVTTSVGATRSGVSRKTLDTMFAYEGENYSVDGSLFLSQGVRSDLTYTDFYGNSFDLKDNSELNPTALSLNGNYEGFEFKMLIDRYHTTERDRFDEALSRDQGLDFDSFHFSLSRPIRITPELEVIPLMSLRRQDPWEEVFVDEGGQEANFRKSIERFTGRLTAKYKPTKDLEVTGGVEYYEDYARDNDEEGLFFNNSQSVRFDNIALFGQAIYSGRIGDVTLGSRYEDHERFGSAFVPRLSLSKVFDKLHFKLLASSAFRAPAIENINANETAIQSGGHSIRSLEREETQVYEFEAGWKFSPNLSLVSSVSYSKISDPIVYFYDGEADIEGYRNDESMGSIGYEGELRWKGNWGYWNNSYSLYRSVDLDSDIYQVPGYDKHHLGLSRHKLVSYGSYNLSDELSLNPRATVYGRRFGYDGADSDEVEILREFRPTVLLDLNVNYDVPSMKGLTLSAGVFNLLNEDFRFIQPYNSFHAPLGSLSREFLVKAIYEF